MLSGLARRAVGGLRAARLQAIRPTAPVNARSFHWDSAVYAYSEPESIKLFKTWESHISSMRANSGDVKPVEPINWSEWEKIVGDPAVVDSLRKEYESHKFADINPDDFLQDFNKQADQLIGSAEKKATEAAKHVEPIESDLAKRKWVRDHFWTLNFDEVASLYPGMSEDAESRLWWGEVTTNKIEDEVVESLTDLSEYRKRLSNGQPINMPPVLVELVESKPDKYPMLY